MPITAALVTAPACRTAKWSMASVYAVCGFMLLVAGYGIWDWFKLPIVHRLPGRDEIFYMLCLVILPLVMFLFLTVVMTQRTERMRLSGSYQSRIDQMQRRLNYQEDLLHLVMNSHPETMTIFDQQNRYWFVNQHAARALGADVPEIIGKSLSRFVGHDRARKIEARLSDVRNTGEAIDVLEQINNPGEPVRIIQMHYETVAPFGELKNGVMLREEDVTTLIVERERRESMLRQVIRALVAVVDRRDPYASGHSSRVGQLARAIAEEMMLDEELIETAEIAGSLMNFGKVLVPRDILTKTKPLTPEELQRVRHSILTSADILSIIDFVGPVVPTLRQALERFDGSGAPEGLKGEDILITARIVMAANSYVALVSPRAHRPSMELHPALDQMTKDSGKIYDPRVVQALGNYIENHSAKLDWLTRSKQI
jgi:PAS domain S-box-containing protein